ncbi:Crp/Fnr family transcriptional regulator [Tunicatimonas pelagia]|uniref:Crp/Fnr family transcriptional regulator n=1 Tax=Tunicatimonas pelagia TaxID=931531 RepID=UPI00266589B4|nr:Crp/Fnr family transcriptional regulator [Tunicatimonas pelagia]WKN43440.1 Crp/Fnr family transcriptional regulator [Tunicatimonas pelagia]
MINKSEILEKHFNLQELRAGEYFVKEGQYSKHIGYVEAGLLHSYQIDRTGDTVTTNFFLPEAFCGSFFSFYRHAPALDSVKAITEARIHTIGYDQLQALFREDLGINQLGRLAIEEVCIEKDIRLTKMLKLDAKDRYLWFIKEYPAVVEKSPLKFIASYLGMKPESLSRIRRELIS